MTGSQKTAGPGGKPQKTKIDITPKNSAVLIWLHCFFTPLMTACMLPRAAQSSRIARQQLTRRAMASAILFSRNRLYILRYISGMTP